MDILGVIVGLCAAIVSLISILKVNDMVKKKEYTPEEKKKYLITWICILIGSIVIIIWNF